MNSTLRRRLTLEQLEDRLVPSVTIMTDTMGNMTISGSTNSGTLDINATGYATYNIDDGGTPILTNQMVPGNLTLNLTGPENVNVFLNGNSTGNNLSATFDYNSSSVLISGGTIAGSLQLTRADSLLMFGTTVGGNLSIQDSTKNVNENLSIGNSSVGGTLNVTTGNGADALTLSATPVGSSAYVNLGNAGLFGNTFTQNGGSTIGGSLSVMGGSSADNVDIEDSVEGSVYLNLGGGNNIVTLGATATIGAGFTDIGGLGDDSLNTFAGTVAGSIYLNLGGGNNTVDFTGTMGGTGFSYYGGSGVDNVTFDGQASQARLSFSLGAGNDSLTLTANARFNYLWSDFGLGTDSFINNTNRYFPMALMNLP